MCSIPVLQYRWLPWRGIILCRLGFGWLAHICQGTNTWLWLFVWLGLGCRGVAGTQAIPAGTTSWPGFGSMLGWIYDRLLCAWDGTRQSLERLSSGKTENNGNPSSSEGASLGTVGSRSTAKRWLMSVLTRQVEPPIEPSVMHQCLCMCEAEGGRKRQREREREEREGRLEDWMSFSSGLGFRSVFFH